MRSLALIGVIVALVVGHEPGAVQFDPVHRLPDRGPSVARRGQEGHRQHEPFRLVVQPVQPRQGQPGRVIPVHLPGRRSHAVVGVASWYCGHGSRCPAGDHGSLSGAAGPSLRVGNWRGRIVTVQANGRSIRVKLVDWCACPQRVIDLFSGAFQELAPLSQGLVRVKVSW